MGAFPGESSNVLAAIGNHLIVTGTRPVEMAATAAWLGESVPGVRRFAVHCPDEQSMRARWERCAGLQGPATQEAVEFFIEEAFPFAPVFVFTSMPGNFGLADWLEESQMEELTSRTQALAVDLFDGSGVLFWRRQPP